MLNKAISTPIAIVIILILALIVGGFVWWQCGDMTSKLSETEVSEKEEKEEQPGIVGWKKLDFGYFRIQHPSDGWEAPWDGEKGEYLISKLSPSGERREAYMRIFISVSQKKGLSGELERFKGFGFPPIRCKNKKEINIDGELALKCDWESSSDLISSYWFSPAIHNNIEEVEHSLVVTDHNYSKEQDYATVFAFFSLIDASLPEKQREDLKTALDEMIFTFRFATGEEIDAFLKKGRKELDENDHKRLSDFSSIYLAQNIYYDDEDHYFQSETMPVSISKYLNPFPKDPGSGPCSSYQWISNIKDSKKFCTWGCLSDGRFIAASHKGTKALKEIPTDLDCW